MAKLSPVQRTLSWLREEGYDRERIAKVELWNQYSQQKTDAWGLFDYLVLDPPQGVLGVQCCGADVSAHKAKMESNPMLEVWLQQNRALLIGWRKVKYSRGGTRMIYRPRVVWL